jgi:hypothetical protein
MKINRRVLQVFVIALIALCLGVAGTAAVLASIPDTGSAPSIFDDFNWSSISNRFWHVNAYGADGIIKGGTLTLKGDSIELDRRVQTDPYRTVVSAKIRALSFDKFGLGLGIYHSGTLGMEVDTDGVKCGRATDHGYQVDVFEPWTRAPVGKWLYLYMDVVNPYPDPKVLEKLGNVDFDKLKKVTLHCAVYDAGGHLLSKDTAKDPPPNSHYVALDEAYVRTWDSNNDYQLDWFYAGSPAGDPLNGLVTPRP